MIGLVVVMHKSSLRPNGFKLISNYIKTLYRHCEYYFELFLMDNASIKKYKVPTYSNIEYVYIKDQKKRGVTGAWNDGIKRAINSNCDIILVTNDDISFNKSVNKFIKTIKEHEHNNVSLYGPLSDGMLDSVIHQKADKAGEGLKEITNKMKNVINGFFMGFTKEFYEKFKLPDNNLFVEKYKWGGQERELQKRIKRKGGRMFVVKDCWIHHKKIRGWKKPLRDGIL